MITLKSTYKEFIDLCVKAGACSEHGAIPYMVEAEKRLSEKIKGVTTVEDGINDCILDKSFPDFHVGWVLKTIGKELDEETRILFMGKLINPMDFAKLYIDCPFLTDKEDELLKSKFEGQLPTVEKELITNIVTRAKVSK